MASNQQAQMNTQSDERMSNSGNNELATYDDSQSARGEEAPGDWYYDGAEITEHDGQEGEKTVSARILKKTLKESKRLEPTIDDIENIEAGDGGAKVKISWKPPSKLKRDKIQEYLVEIDDCEEEKEEDEHDVAERYENDTRGEFDLKPSRTYKVRVIVIDLDGNRYESEFREFDTASGLGTPEIDEISELRSSDPDVKKVMITWIAPSGVEDDEMEEHQLIIESEESQNRKVICCPPTERSRVCYLEPETKYEVSVKTITKVGETESEKEDFETGEALGKPEITKIECVSEDKANNIETIKISWNPPDVEEDKILKYEATVEMIKPGKKSKGPQSKTKCFAKSADSGEFDLEIGSKYSCSVTIFAIHAEATSEPKVVCAEPGFGKPAIENIYEIAPSKPDEKKKQVIVIWKAPAGIEKKDVKEYKIVYQVQKKDTKKSIKTKKTHAIFWMDSKTTFVFTVEVKTDVGDDISEEKSFSTTHEQQPVVKQKSGSNSSQTGKDNKNQNANNKVQVYDNDRKMAAVVAVDKDVHDDIVKSQNQRGSSGSGSSSKPGSASKSGSGSGSGSGGKSSSQSGKNDRHAKCLE